MLRVVTLDRQTAIFMRERVAAVVTMEDMPEVTAAAEQVPIRTAGEGAAVLVEHGVTAETAADRSAICSLVRAVAEAAAALREAVTAEVYMTEAPEEIID